MLMQDIQVVNGLQTTETIYRHFASGSTRSADRTLAIKIIVSRDERLRDQIIRATNNQSTVEQASLHATEKIQRDIEQILEKYEFFYERRQNYYRNIGKPPARFVTPLFVASACVALVIKQPAAAALLKNKFMRSQSRYEAVFSERRNIEIWPRIVAVLKVVEEEMLRAPRSRDSHRERFLRSWRGLIGLLFLARTMKKFDYSESDILTIDINNVDRKVINECREFVEEERKGDIGGRRSGSILRPSHDFARRVCREFAKLYSLTGVECVGHELMPAVYAKRPATYEFSGHLVDQVDALLPPQPWPQGIHSLVAAKLGVAPKLVSSVIRHLMESGRRQTQMFGELVESGEKSVTTHPSAAV